MSLFVMLKKHTQTQLLELSENENKALIRTADQLVKLTNPIRPYLAQSIAKHFPALVNLAHKMVDEPNLKHAEKMLKTISNCQRSIRELRAVMDPELNEQLYKSIKRLSPIHAKISRFLTAANDNHRHVLEMAFPDGITPRWHIEHVSSTHYFTEIVEWLTYIKTISCWKGDVHTTTVAMPANTKTLSELLNYLRSILIVVHVHKIRISEGTDSELQVFMD